MNRRIKAAAILGVTIVGISGGVYFGFQRALRVVPSFYVEESVLSAAERRSAADQFERDVLAFHNDLQDVDLKEDLTWQHVFDEREINGWLATELAETFPELLPPAVEKPRVALVPGRMLVAFQYRTEKVSTVVSVHLGLAMADTPNTLAVRIFKAQAGLIPLPLKDFLDQVSDIAWHADIALQWAQADGDPVALIALPSTVGSKGAKPFSIESVTIDQKSLTVAGRTLTEQGAQSEAGRSAD